MLADFFIPFVSVALAELGDKTQLAVFSLSSRTSKHYELLAGVLLAFLLSSIIAVVFGGLIAQFIPQNVLKIIAGILFIGFGVFSFLETHNKLETPPLRNPFISAFTLVFLSEIGDKSQLTVGLFATRFEPLWVFVGSFLALALLSIAAVYVGKTFLTKINHTVLSYFSAVLFIAIGIAFLLL